MKINNQVMGNSVRTNDSPMELKQGEVYSTAIKERLTHDEAIVQIRGRDVQVKFQDGVPHSDRAVIQVTGNKDGMPQVKTVEVVQNSQGSDHELDNILRAGKSTVTPELRQLANVLIDQGLPLSKDTLVHLKTFLEKETGTFQQKVDTVQATIAKGLDATAQHLHAVHEALHGRPISDSLATLMREMDINQEHRITVNLGPLNEPSDGAASIRAMLRTAVQHVQQSTQLERAISVVLQQFAESATVPTEVAAKLAKTIDESLLLQQKGMSDLARQWLVQTIQQIEATLASNENVDKAIPQISEAQAPISLAFAQVQGILSGDGRIDTALAFVRSQIVPHPEMTDQLSKGLEQRLSQIETLFSNQQHARAKAELIHVLDETEVGIPIHKQVSEQFQELGVQSARNDAKVEQMQSPMLDFSNVHVSTKQYVVTEVTQKMSELALDFKQQKREITRNLDNVSRLIDQFKQHALPQAKSILESTIDKIDRAILKSEFLLYSDMKTEKQLLIASSQLADARRMLTKGEYSQAQKVVQDVKDALAKINWQPADVKVRHMLMKGLSEQGRTATRPQVGQGLQHVSSELTRQEAGARGLFEAIRALGIHHDSEIAQSMSNKSVEADQEQLQRNMKAVMLHLLKGDQELKPNSRNAIEHILNNLTGQQLLSKNDINSNQQSLFFNIPIQLHDQESDLKLYVNAKKEGEKVDWENCSLYFLIETKKLGDTGILINATDRKLAITLKNDTPLFKEQMVTVVDRHKDNIQDIGYQITSVQFTRLNPEMKEAHVAGEKESIPVLPPNGSKRGFDSKI